MDFADQLRRYPVATIEAAFPGIKKATIYSWRERARKPPEWLQPVILREIEKTHAAPKINTNTAPESAQAPR